MNLFENVLHLFYPPVCGFCKTYCKQRICENCLKKIREDEKNVLEIIQGDLSEHFYLFEYDGYIRDKILDYKFCDNSYLCYTFAKIMLKNKKFCQFLERYDIMCPVPLSKKRKCERGYNQSLLIAKQIVKELKNIALDEKSLVKIKDIKPQSTKSKNERQTNVKDAYKVIKNETIIGKKILLIDDILTTGSTAKECATVLIKNGAKNVGIVTLAKD